MTLKNMRQYKTQMINHKTYHRTITIHKHESNIKYITQSHNNPHTITKPSINPFIMTPYNYNGTTPGSHLSDNR